MYGIKEIFSAYLNQLRQEIVLFDKEENIWKITGKITNPAGTLALHICGNLKHYICNIIGRSDFTRNREAEFTLRVTKDQLLEEIDRTREMIMPVLEKITQEDLTKSYTTGSQHSENLLNILLKIATHASYHTGQINYLRRYFGN